MSFKLNLILLFQCFHRGIMPPPPWTKSETEDIISDPSCPGSAKTSTQKPKEETKQKRKSILTTHIKPEESIQEWTGFVCFWRRLQRLELFSGKIKNYLWDVFSSSLWYKKLFLWFLMLLLSLSSWTDVQHRKVPDNCITIWNLRRLLFVDSNWTSLFFSP